MSYTRCVDTIPIVFFFFFKRCIVISFCNKVNIYSPTLLLPFSFPFLSMRVLLRTILGKEEEEKKI